MLFEPDKQQIHKRKDKSGLAVSKRERDSATAAKRQIDRIDNIETAVSNALSTGTLVDPQTREVWELPQDIVDAIKDGRLKRGASLPQLGYNFEDEIEPPIKNLVPANYDHLEGFTDEPGYWLHIRDKDNPQMWTCYPVYGYMLDRGRRNAVPPVLEVTPEGRRIKPGWKDAEWLCRCAQCGRELPPKSFDANSHHRVVGICRLCSSINKAVDKIYKRQNRFILQEDWELLGRVTELYDYEWFRGLLPRGAYAAHLIGEENIKKRLKMCYAVRPSGFSRYSKRRILQSIDNLDISTDQRMLYLFEKEESTDDEH